MVTRAELRYIRITPRKFRQIIPLIKGMNAESAVDFLASVKKKASFYAIAIIKSALANTKRMQGVDASHLFISNLVANCGPSLKRYRAGSMGRASVIKKRTCHIIVELDMKKPAHEVHEKNKAAQKKIKKVVKAKTG